MTINLLMNTSPPNFVNKNPTNVGTIEGTLRSPTSIVDPVIIIEKESPLGFNYIQIPSFNRYYYVNGIVSQSNNLVAISCHVDVLMSYANQINDFDVVVRRNENKFNLYLDDGIFKAYQNTKHKIIKFPYGFTQYSYVLALAGNGSE